MKPASFLVKNKFQLAIFAFAVLLGQTALAAVGFTITPSAISNTYNGTVALQITGLTSGDTVVVQTFLDLNTNGVVDGADILWQQFQLADGQASVFHDGSTAVTNFNVPGDTDGSTNGSITAKLHPGSDFSQTIIGKYLFVLSSPAGHFTPITNSFSVTNFPYAQSFTGSVVSNGTAIPDAIVILFQPADGGQNPVGGAVANNAGVYSIKAATGAYTLGAAKSNFVENLNAAASVTLGAGATITSNLALTNATESISGNVIDVNNSTIGLAGVLVPVQTASNYLAVAFTDTNGNYTARVTPDQWKVGQNEKGLMYKGYLSLRNTRKVDTTSGSVSGVTIALPKETAVFYGRVRDNLGNPLPGVTISSDDNNGNYEAEGVTDTNGNYVAAALGGLNNDQWSVSPNQGGSGPSNYIYSQGQFNITLTNGQAFRSDFTAVLAANLITGHVQFNGNPVSGVGVNGNATINGVNYSAFADTDTNGNYSLNVANGSWSVSVNCNGGNDSLDNILGNGNYQCPNNQNVTINNNNANADFTIVPVGSGQIFGHVLDSDGNAIVGVAVHADDGLGDIFSNSTDTNGFYSIVVADGSWDVSVDCTQLNSLGYQCTGDQNVSVSDDSIEQDFTVPANNPSLPFKVLHGFAALDINGFNSDGASPFAGLILSGGNLYGTTVGGGTADNGTVFAVSTNGLVFTNLHSFAITDTNGFNIEGASPAGRLVLSGNTLYGTAAFGGSSGNGTVFAINTNSTGFATRYTFTGGSDGTDPTGNLILSGNLLYGTAVQGGSSGNGTAFSVNTNGAGITGLHGFTATDTNGFNNDGTSPVAGLVLSGNMLYGTAAQGGTSGAGTVFAINTIGPIFTNLHEFTFNDGVFPEADLILSGNTLYGTANGGGSSGDGTIFAINTDGTGFTNLHSFTATDTNGFNNDGAFPEAGLILSSNTLYGTANGGGGSGVGTVFALKTNGMEFVTLHTFTGGSDGANPVGDLVLSGNILYGTASAGGSSGNGTVFALSLTAPPPPPTISSPARLGGQFHMTVNGSAGQNYTIQLSTNLGSTNWISLLITNSAASSFLFTDPNATNSPRFYRVLVGP